MTAPLGGKRRERKRLKRCAHRGAGVWRDPADDAAVVECRDCGSTARVSSHHVTALVGMTKPMNETIFAEHMTRKLPPRIARKAVDA